MVHCMKISDACYGHQTLLGTSFKWMFLPQFQEGGKLRLSCPVTSTVPREVCACCAIASQETNKSHLHVVDRDEADWGHCS